MSQKFEINLEDELFNQLKEVCKGDESVMQDYITHIIKEKFNQINNKTPSEHKKDTLENYLKNSQSGSRKYGVKGQGW